MTTVLDIINGASRLIGIKSEGQALTGEQTETALELLNQLLEEWNIDGAMVYTINRDVYSLAPGTQLYTFGVGGTLGSTRQTEIDRIGVIPQTSSTYPNEIPIQGLSDKEWSEVVIKNVPSTFPLMYWDNGNYPLRGLNFWPIPTTACQVVIYSWNQVSAFTSVSQSLSFPPGYARALRYGLALEMAVEYDRTDKVALLGQAAMASKAKIKERNYEIEYMNIDCGSKGSAGLARQSRGWVVD
jgi:hypothetical protein